MNIKEVKTAFKIADVVLNTTHLKNHIKFNYVEDLVDEILKEKKNSPEADTSDLENKIDKLVMNLYNLTPEEIKIIENQTK